MKRQIKFLAHVARWFDRVNGNTYHSVNIENVETGEILYCPMTYGYGDHYKQTALEAMAGFSMTGPDWLPAKYCQDADYMVYERENNYPIIWIVKDGLKRDCIRNGGE